MSQNPTVSLSSRLNHLAYLLRFTGTPAALAHALDNAGFVPIEGAAKTVSREAYERAVDWVRNNRLDELSGTGVVDELLSRLDLMAAPPKTPEEKIADFARTLARYLPSGHATLTRDQLADLVRERLGVEI